MKTKAPGGSPAPVAAATAPAGRTVGILVPTDFSALAQVAIDTVVSLVRDNPEVKVTLLHVVEPWHGASLAGVELPIVRSLWQRTVQAERELERLRSRVDPHIRMDVRVLTGNPARVICDLAHSERFNVIILSSHGDTGLARVFIGSVAERVVQDAACPVLVVKPRRDEAGQFVTEAVQLKLEHLLVGYDHRNGSKRALTIARAIAKPAGASITLVHALAPPPALGPSQSIAPCNRDADEAQATEWLRHVAETYETSAKNWDVWVGTGHPWDIIIDSAKSSASDLIIIGPHEHTRWGHCFVGSTAQRVVRLAPCSVLAVK